MSDWNLMGIDFEPVDLPNLGVPNRVEPSLLIYLTTQTVIIAKNLNRTGDDVSQRNDIIDVFRGIAVLLVTGFHLFMWSGTSTIPLWGGFDAMGIFGNGWIGVGLFFVISGYCMFGVTSKAFNPNVTCRKYSMYFLKRYLRIAIPYYISIVFWVFVIERFGVAVKPTGTVDIITHLLFIHNLHQETFFSISGVYWSLAVEMQFYLLLPLFLVFFRKVYSQLIVLFFSASVGIAINLLSSNQLFTWGLSTYLYLFLLGWLLAMHQRKIANVVTNPILMALMVIISVALLCYKGNGFNNHIKIYELIISTIVGLLMVGFISLNDSRTSGYFIKTMSFIGVRSYSIYLYNYVFWFFERNNLNIFSIISIYFFVLLFGTFMHYIVERNAEKFRRIIFNSQEPVTITSTKSL